jgi:hypothetical protein
MSKEIEIYRLKVVATALELYANTGIKASRAYTPTAMLKVANEATGLHFKRGQYLQAAKALREFATGVSRAV